MKKEKKVKKISKIKRTFSNTNYLLKYVWKVKKGKRYILLKIINSVVNSIFPLALTVFPGLIINELTFDRRLNVIILYVSLLILAPVIKKIYNYLTASYLGKVGFEINLNIETEFLRYVQEMDYETVEIPSVQVLKDRASDALMGSLNVIDLLSSLILSVCSLIAVSTVITSLNVFVILLIVIVVFINSRIAKYYTNKKHKLSQELSKYDRYQGAYMYMLENFEYAQEIRLFNSGPFLTKLYSDSKEESNKVEVKFINTRNKPELFGSFLTFLQQALIYVYLVYMVLEKDLLIGTMTIFITAVSQFSTYLNQVFKSYLNLSSNSLKVDELKDFMEIPNQQLSTGTKKPEFDENTIIEFKNVSFKYPGSEIYALRNLSIKLNAKEKLCIVGVNGSGKSTFIKLLTRLYMPTEGKILLNGIDIYEYDYKEYQKLFAPVFQNFATYEVNIEQNVSLSFETDKDRLNKVLDESGLDPLVNKLPKKEKTSVGKWIDEEGIEPSGGEEQRLAIARACYKGGNIFLLDEPTAALDPFAEYEIYKQFDRMTKDKMTIFITHRLSAVQLADKVAVFEEGNIVEYGTHDSLYDENGLYTKMFDTQAEFYKNAKKNN